MKQTKLFLFGSGVVGIFLACFIIFAQPMSLARAAVHISDSFFGEGNRYCISCADFGYRLALVINKQVPNALHQRARIAFLRGDFATARDLIDKQIELHGNTFMASYYIRGLIEGYAGNFPNAEENFKIFLEWDKRNWAVHNDLAWVYFAQGRYHDAYHIADSGLRYNPNNSWLLNARGISAFNLGNLELAKRDIESALLEVEKLGISDWIRAYPGNDPEMAAFGLKEMKNAFKENKDLVYKNLAKDDSTLYYTE